MIHWSDKLLWQSCMPVVRHSSACSVTWLCLCCAWLWLWHQCRVGAHGLSARSWHSDKCRREIEGNLFCLVGWTILKYAKNKRTYIIGHLAWAVLVRRILRGIYYVVPIVDTLKGIYHNVCFVRMLNSAQFFRHFLNQVLV